MTQGSVLGAKGNWPGSTLIDTTGTIENGVWLGDSLAKPAEGRLTLTTNVPVTTTDVTAATTIYYTPFRGNRLSLYSNSKWTDYIFTQLSIAVPATTNTMYDVFVYLSGSTPTLELTSWSSDTARTTLLTTQDGIYVKNGDATRRYLGSFRTTDVSGQTEDSLAKRYVWNYYNRLKRFMKAVDSTNSWTYSSTTFRQARATSTNQLDFVLGVSEDSVNSCVMARAVSNSVTTVTVAAGIGLDGSTTPVFTLAIACNTRSPYDQTPNATYDIQIAEGRHTLLWLERGGGGSPTITWLGDDGNTYTQLGIFGFLHG